MDVKVLGHKHLANGSTEVTLTADGMRFTATIPTSYFGTKQAEPLYEFMAERQVAQMARLREITAPGRQLAD